MDNDAPRRSLSKVVAAGAVAVGLAAGSYGVASAASGSGSSAVTSGRAATRPRPRPPRLHSIPRTPGAASGATRLC